MFEIIYMPKDPKLDKEGQRVIAINDINGESSVFIRDFVVSEKEKVFVYSAENDSNVKIKLKKTSNCEYIQVV
jgi:hypothetical protein